MTELLPASPLGTTVNPASGSLTAGAVGDAEIAVDAFGMIPGTYNLQLSVEPTVDGAEAITLPFTLQVQEPAIRLSASKIERSGILLMGPPDTVALATESNTGGFFDSWTARLIDADPSMSVQNASGFVGDPLIVRFDPNQATRSGEFYAILEIEAGTARYQVELSYAVDSLEVVKMAADPTRPVVYALSRSRFEGIGNVVVVDPYSGELLKTIRIGGRPSDLAISPDGQAVYVISSADMTISQIDPVDLELVRTVAVPGEKWRGVSSDDPVTLEAGNNGRIYYTSGASPLRMLDFESVAVLETLEPFQQPGDPTFSRFGDLFLDPIAEKLFFAGAGSNQRVMIGSLDISDDGLSPAGVQAADGNVNLLNEQPEILADLNGDQFFLDRYLFPRPEMPGSGPLADDTIIGLSAYGDLAVSRYGVIDVRNGQQLAALPDGVAHVVFSPDQTSLLLYHFSGPIRFSSFPLPGEIRPPPVAIRPEPSDGGFLDVATNQLRWSALPRVEGYRIFLGTDRAGVAAAMPGSPEDQGVVSDNSFTLDSVPTSGIFYWRIDAIRRKTVISGDIFSFGIGSIRVSPSEVVITAPRTARPQSATLEVLNGDDERVGWEATSSTPWIELPKAAGTADEPLVVILNPAGLEAGFQEGSVQVGRDGMTLDVPVNLQLFEVNLSKLIADPNRALVYGLQTGERGGPTGYIVSIDAATGNYLRSFSLKDYATTFAMHPLENRLYVPLESVEDEIQVFDLTSGDEMPSLNFPIPGNFIGNIYPGRVGRIYVENERFRPALHAIDTTSGEDLGVVVPETSQFTQPVAVADLAGENLYRTGRDNLIQRIDISTDTPSILGTTAVDRTRFTSTFFASLSRDGNRLLTNQAILDGELNFISQVPEVCQAISGDGQVVASGSNLYWAETGSLITPLPQFYSQVSFSSDGRYLVAWDGAAKRVVSIQLDTLVDLPGPMPRSGERLEISPELLTWSEVADATNYRVYLGTNENKINSAGSGSPLLIGSPPVNNFSLDAPLDISNRYFWRVDAVTPGGIIAGSVQFFDLPFQPTGPPMESPVDDPDIQGEFGSFIEASSDGLWVTGRSAYFFDFDFNSGENSLNETVKLTTSGSEEFGDLAAPGPGLFIASDPNIDFPLRNTGEISLYRPLRSGRWDRMGALSAPEEGLQNIGNRLEFGSNQLLARVGDYDSGDGSRSPARVFPYFQWPDWTVGPELIHTPANEDDGFGAALVLDGTRTLVGAPHSRSSSEGGSAFIFEFDAAAQRWTQKAHLRPSDGDDGDNAGGSVALQGDLAVIGSGSRVGRPAGRQVQIFRRDSSNQWRQDTTLIDPEFANTTSGSSGFGYSLAVHEDLLFVAAPFGNWRGQPGGIVYCFRNTGSTWEPMAPIIPPQRGFLFGAEMTIKNGWLFVSHYQGEAPNRSPWNTLDRIYAYRIDPSPNYAPSFETSPPVQVVRGRSTEISIQASDPDGNEGLSFLASDLPAGLLLEDLGNGQAKITGIPTDPVGTQRWVRIPVADPLGKEAVQTALIEVLANNDLPSLTDLPGSLDLEIGEALELRPTVGGTGPFSWRWQLNGVDLSSESNPRLSRQWVTEADAGVYTVRVSNAVGTTESDPIQVGVGAADRFAGDWITSGSDPSRDGHQAATLGRHRFQAIWESEALPRLGLNPVAIVEGRVFVSARNPNRSHDARAYDLANGELLWSQPFGVSDVTTSPSWHDGRIYILQRADQSNLWSLDAASGNVLWKTPSVIRGSEYTAPAVSDLGIFARGGSSLGLYGYNLDGSERFFRGLQIGSFNDGWTPAIADGRLFTLVRERLTEHDPLTGATLWNLSSEASGGGSRSGKMPLVTKNRAFFIGQTGVIGVDTEHREVLWTTAGSFVDNPATDGKRLYALTLNEIHALSLDDGSEMAVYKTGDESGDRLIGQPLLLNDTLVAATENRTFIFDLSSTELIQEIPHGGFPSYANSYLVLAGSDGVVRTYLANAAPGFSAELPSNITANPAADDLLLPLAPFASDPDPEDTLTWAVVSNSNSDLFRTLEVDPDSGELRAVYNPWQSGTSEVTLSVTDPAGNVTSTTMTFAVPPHPAPGLELAESFDLNRRTGLYEHTVTVTNSALREIAGFDLAISKLPEGARVYGASPTVDGVATLGQRRVLAAGESVTLNFSYYLPIRGTELAPDFAATIVTGPEETPVTDAPGLEIDRCLIVDDAVLIEFTTTVGRLYEVQYSSDNATWKVAPTRIRAGGNRVQWIDRGPPQTDSPPLDKSTRFYRVRELPENE